PEQSPRDSAAPVPLRLHLDISLLTRNFRANRMPIIPIGQIGNCKTWKVESACLTLLPPPWRAVGSIRQGIADRARVEHCAARIVSATELAADLALGFAHAILTATIRLTRKAGEGGKRPFEDAQYLAE